MRVAIIGQRNFGRATLEAFLARGHDVTLALCTAGSPDDAFRKCAKRLGVTLGEYPSLSHPDAQSAMRLASADIGIMAYVTQLVPQELCELPACGMIQFHPSLLPQHRGANSMNWAIIAGRNETGLSVLRPTPEYDRGPVILQRSVEIDPDETLGSLYFKKLFPLGVAALLEAATLVVEGKATETPQREDDATYERVVGEREARIHWTAHIDLIYNLIRGCDPSPGAWTTVHGRKLHIFAARKRAARTLAEVRGQEIGEIVRLDGNLAAHVHGGYIVFDEVRYEGAAKISSAEADIPIGTVLGS